MFSTPEPFLSAEVQYRQQRLAEDFVKHPRRRYRVKRRRHQRMPEQRAGDSVVD